MFTQANTLGRSGLKGYGFGLTVSQQVIDRRSECEVKLTPEDEDVCFSFFDLVDLRFMIVFVFYYHVTLFFVLIITLSL